LLSKKYVQVLLVLVAFLLPSILYLGSSNFLGYDSYYFLTQVCGGNPIYDAPTNAPLHDLLLPYLPCNDFLLKLVLVTLFGMALLTIYAITRIRYKEHAHLGTLFALVSPILLYNAFKFENDAFAFPIMYASLYFFLKYLDSGKQKKIFLLPCLGLLFVASLFWGASLYYLLIFTIFEPLLLLFTIPLLLLFFGSLFGGILPDFAVNENNPLQGVLAFLFFQIFWLLPRTKKVFDFDFKKLTIVLVGVGLLNPKFMVLAIPMLSLTLSKVYSMLDSNNKKKMVALSMVLVVGFALPIGLGSLHPSLIEHEAVKDLVEYSVDLNKPIGNDWSYGHLVYFYGGETYNHSTWQRKSSSFGNSVVLSRKDLNCGIIKEYPSNPLEGNMKIYDC